MPARDVAKPYSAGSERHVDVECGSTTNDLNRQKDVDFANTTYVEQVRIAVKANSGINDVKDLNGKTVATTTGTTSVQLLRQNKRAEGIEFKNIMGKDHADSFLLLETGRADAFRDGRVDYGGQLLQVPRTPRTSRFWASRCPPSQSLAWCARTILPS